MSQAGRPKARNAADAIMQGAARASYVCTLKRDAPDAPGMRTIRCQGGCGRDVVAVPWNLAEQRARAAELDVKLIISCYGCAVDAVKADGVKKLVVELPKPLDAGEIERLRRPA